MHHRNCPIAVDPRNESCDCAALRAIDLKERRKILRRGRKVIFSVGKEVLTGVVASRYSGQLCINTPDGRQFHVWDSDCTPVRKR